MTWMQSLHRHPAGAGHPARGRGGRRGLLARAARRRPAGPGARHLRVGRLPPGDPGRGARPAEAVSRARRSAHAGSTTGRRPAAPPTLERAEHRPGDVRRDRRARQAGPPRRGVRRRRRARGQRPRRAVRRDGQRGRAARRSTSSTPPTCSSSTRRWTTATRSRWSSTTRTPRPRPTRSAPTSASRMEPTRTTCWSAHASTGITTARWSSGRTGSSTARSPRKRSTSSTDSRRS